MISSTSESRNLPEGKKCVSRGRLSTISVGVLAVGSLLCVLLSCHRLSMRSHWIYASNAHLPPDFYFPLTVLVTGAAVTVDPDGVRLWRRSSPDEFDELVRVDLRFYSEEICRRFSSFCPSWEKTSDALALVGTLADALLIVSALSVLSTVVGVASGLFSTIKPAEWFQEISFRRITMVIASISVLLFGFETAIGASASALFLARADGAGLYVSDEGYPEFRDGHPTNLILLGTGVGEREGRDGGTGLG